jgi:ribonuclease HI
MSSIRAALDGLATRHSPRARAQLRKQLQKALAAQHGHLEPVCMRDGCSHEVGVWQKGLRPYGAFRMQLDGIARKHAGRGPQSGVFCDGSFRWGTGGWGIVAVQDARVQWTAHGREALDTLSGVPVQEVLRMEVTAVVAALRRISEHEVATIYSDSRECIRIMNGDAEAGGPGLGEAARALADEAQSLARARPGVTYAWLKGHAGNTWSEYADCLARSNTNAARNSACDL